MKRAVLGLVVAPRVVLCLLMDGTKARVLENSKAAIRSRTNRWFIIAIALVVIRREVMVMNVAAVVGGGHEDLADVLATCSVLEGHL